MSSFVAGCSPFAKSQDLSTIEYDYGFLVTLVVSNPDQACTRFYRWASRQHATGGDVSIA